MKVKPLLVQQGLFVAFNIVMCETSLETREEDPTIPIVRFQVVMQAGLLP